MQATLRGIFRASGLRYLYHRIKALGPGRGQSDEAVLVRKLAAGCTRTFVEFGFHPTEYNCILLDDFEGLLVDGDPDTVRLARAILPRRIEVLQRFLTLDNLGEVADHFPGIGVLSIDVDGNDYWFAEALLPKRPQLLVVEYNASLGLAPITVPYDPAFERHARHPSGWYHGASITALARLCARHGMKLVAVSSGGGNAFFAREDSPLPALDPRQAYRESTLRNRWSGTTAGQQFEAIREMPYVSVG